MHPPNRSKPPSCQNSYSLLHAEAQGLTAWPAVLYHAGTSKENRIPPACRKAGDRSRQLDIGVSGEYTSSILASSGTVARAQT